MARRLNVARQTYLDVETGKSDIKVNRLLDICSILDVSPLYLLLSDDDARLRQLRFFEGHELTNEINRRLEDAQKYYEKARNDTRNSAVA
ncbi:helix-turn-helix domain-containing protein [Photobacterium leiognathi]